ncbi:acetate--CoA ligase family protein [bacterium]|nr:acetate--CoA ligase family protein [bacterium]
MSQVKSAAKPGLRRPVDATKNLRNLDAIFKPKSIAVIGASRTPETIGHTIVKNLVDFGFNGPVYPVNPKAKFIRSMRAYRSVLEIPDEVDMAIVCVPKQLALQAVDDCGRKDIKAVIMITAGFSETGTKGAQLEQQIFERIRHYGMSMIGPNCMGVINTDAGVRMDATFASHLPLEGNIGFLSQSGALGVAIIERATSMKLGLSSFVSLGNHTDVSVDDCLAFWKDDDLTELVLLYIESFGDPHRFVTLTREMNRKKPIIAVKSGRTAAGAKAASSHTASLAASDVSVEALFEATGVLRVDTVEKLFDYAQAFKMQPLPQGARIGIVSNGGGPAILATDAVGGYGLEMAEFSEETREKLRKVLAEDASINNPVDMIAAAGAKEFELVAGYLLEDPNIDAVVVLFTPPRASVTAKDVANGIVNTFEKNRDRRKPIVCCFLNREDEREGKIILRNAGVPVYEFPEAAVQSLAAMYRYRKMQERPVGQVIGFEDVDRKKVRKIIDGVLSSGRSALNRNEVFDLLRAWRFPVISSDLIDSRERLVKAAKKMKYPVVLKLAADEVSHKSDVGGIKLNLRNEAELLEAYDEVAANVAKLTPKIKKWAVTIEPMIIGGREVVLGVSSDPLFGKLIMVGMGGIYVEVLKDVAFRLAPVADVDARSMVESLRGYPILKGIRGEKPVHLKYLNEQIERLSALAVEFPEISEMDMNPVLFFSKKEQCMVVDARMNVVPTESKEV